MLTVIGIIAIPLVLGLIILLLTLVIDEKFWLNG